MTNYLWWWMLIAAAANSGLCFYNAYLNRTSKQRFKARWEAADRAENGFRWARSNEQIGVAGGDVVRVTFEVGTPIVRLYLRSPS